MEALHAATIGDPEMMERDADIENSQRIFRVMKSGRLHDPATLDEDKR